MNVVEQLLQKLDLPYGRSPYNKPIYEFRLYKISCISDSRGPRSIIPKARSGHRMVSDNMGNIYSFGGYSCDVDMPDEEMNDIIWMQDCLLFKELWKFNVASRTWKKLRTNGTMPVELASHAAVLVDNQIIVLGGTSIPFGESSSNSINFCDLSTLTWIKPNVTGEAPLPQYGQAVVIHKDMLYTVGGTTGYDYFMNVHCLDLKTKEWSELNAKVKPQGRYRHEITYEDDRLLVFGGGTASESFSLKEIPCFDLNERTWQILPTSSVSPESRLCHGCVRLGDDIYVSGGHSDRTIFSDLWTINIKTLNWKKLPCNLLLPVYFHSTTIFPEGQMFIFGGVTSFESNTRTNKLFSVWLKIPSLTEICWQAFLFYVPHIAKCKKCELLEMGVPLQFLNRVDFE